LDERLELMAEFSCAAWRHAIGINQWERAADWFYVFRDAINESEVVAAGFDLALTEPRVLDGEYSGTYALLGITVRLGRLSNANAPACVSRSAELQRELSDAEWAVLSDAERHALRFEAAFCEARARRCQGDVPGASGLLQELLADSQWLSRAKWARLECEAEWIACLLEASNMAEVVRLSPGLIRQCRDPWSTQLRAKLMICLGNALLCLGEHAESVKVFRGLLASPWIARVPDYWLAARQDLCSALFWDGRTTEALAELRRGERLARALEGSHVSMVFQLFRAEALARLGNLKESATVIARTGKLLEEKGYTGWSGYAHLLLGEVLIELDSPQEAREFLTKAARQLNEAGKRIEGVAAVQLLATLDQDRPPIKEEGRSLPLPRVGLRRS
jgi:tetratricopeptide (TPR) repeat protein